MKSWFIRIHLSPSSPHIPIVATCINKCVAVAAAATVTVAAAAAAVAVIIAIIERTTVVVSSSAVNRHVIEN